jgi:hypothetical protein
MLVVAAALSVLSALSAAPSPKTPAPGATAGAVDAIDLVAGAKQARERYLEGDFAGAVAVAERVHAAFESHAAYTTDGGDWNAWADAQATRAVALGKLSQDADSDAVWSALAVVRPTYMPDKGFVPPRHVARFQALRDALLKDATIAVTIDPAAKNELLFDGRPVVPGVTLDVIAGHHWLGSGGAGRAIDVSSTMVARLREVEAEPAPAVVAPPVDDGPPWLAIGVGTGLVVVAAGVVVGVVLATQQAPAAANPGGTTVVVDASLLNKVSP